MSHVPLLWHAQTLALDAEEWVYMSRARETAEPVLRVQVNQWRQAGHTRFRLESIPAIMFDSPMAGRVPVPRQAILFALGTLEDEDLIEPAGDGRWLIR